MSTVNHHCCVVTLKNRTHGTPSPVAYLLLLLLLLSHAGTTRQGINTAEFDTAEFEVVKSRLTLQKERKEQREQEERAALQAARKAAQQAAKEQARAQRELKKAEAQQASLFFFRLCFDQTACACRYSM